jgi:hypothetical protein
VPNDFIYAELYTRHESGYRIATFIDARGNTKDFAGQSWDVVHLNHLAAQGWRVVQQHHTEDGRTSYLLERERSDVREPPQLY